MKVEVTNQKVEVTIVLNDLEAGYLRCLLFKLRGTNPGFATDLFNKLELLKLPRYDRRYGDSWCKHTRRKTQTVGLKTA